MKARRVGCLLFGLLWVGVFAMTIFVLALGDPAPLDRTGIRNCNPYPKRWTDYLPLIELGSLIVGAILFARAELRSDD